jgi:hypothetical protein
MKTLTTSLLLAGALLGSSSAFAQSNALKANLLSPLFKTGSFFYERKLNDASSLQLGGLVTYWGIGDTKISGFAFTPEYRRYLSDGKQGMEGFYVAPFVRYQQLALSTDMSDGGDAMTAKATLSTLGGGVVVGHQWLFQRRITLDTFFGPSYNSNILKAGASGSEGSASFDVGSFQGFSLRTGVTLGVAF